MRFNVNDIYHSLFVKTFTDYIKKERLKYVITSITSPYVANEGFSPCWLNCCNTQNAPSHCFLLTQAFRTFRQHVTGVIGFCSILFRKMWQALKVLAITTADISGILHNKNHTKKLLLRIDF